MSVILKAIGISNGSQNPGCNIRSKARNGEKIAVFRKIKTNTFDFLISYTYGISRPLEPVRHHIAVMLEKVQMPPRHRFEVMGFA